MATGARGLLVLLACSEVSLLKRGGFTVGCWRSGVRHAWTAPDVVDAVVGPSCFSCFGGVFPKNARKKNIHCQNCQFNFFENGQLPPAKEHDQVLKKEDPQHSAGELQVFICLDVGAPHKLRDHSRSDLKGPWHWSDGPMKRHGRCGSQHQDGWDG